MGISSFADQLEQPLFNTKYLSNQYATEVNKRFKGDLDACLEFYSIFKYSSYTEVKWRRAIDDCVLGLEVHNIPHYLTPPSLKDSNGFITSIKNQGNVSLGNYSYELLKRELYFFEETDQFRIYKDDSEALLFQWAQELPENQTPAQDRAKNVSSFLTSEGTWLSRLSRFSQTKPLLVHINYFSKEPFMNIARNFELMKLQRLCHKDSVVSFIAIQFKADTSEHEMTYCLNGVRGNGVYESDGNNVYSIDFLEGFVNFLIKEQLKDSKADYHFIFQLKSHGSKDLPIVALNQETLNRKIESQNYRINSLSNVALNYFQSSESFYNDSYSLLSNSNFISLIGNNSEQNNSSVLTSDPLLNSLGYSDLSTNELDPNYSYFLESDLYDFVAKLKQKIHLALFFQESCRSKSSRLKRIPENLIHVFRRAPGIQSYSSLNWTKLLEPFSLETDTKEVLINVGEHKMGLLYFYDSEIDKLILEKYNKMKIKNDLMSSNRFLPLASKSSTQDFISFLNDRAYESDDFFYYPSLIHPKNLFGIEGVFGSYSTNLEVDGQLIELISNSNNVLSLEQASYLRSYYTTLFDIYQYSSAHQNLFHFFFEGFPFWKKYQFDFHFRLSKIYHYMLQERVFENGPIRSDLKDFDQNPYLYAPYAMLNILIYGDRAFKVFNFPKGYKKALTKEQELQGVSFTPKGLLYLAYGDKDINYDDLGIDSKNLHYFLRKALQLSDSVLIDKIVSEYIKEVVPLKQYLSKVLSLSARYEFYYGFKKEKLSDAKIKDLSFYPIFKSKNLLLPFYNEQLLEYEWEQIQWARQLDLSLKYQSFGVPIISYQNLFASYIDNSKDWFLALRDIKEVVELSDTVGLIFDFGRNSSKYIYLGNVLRFVPRELRIILKNFINGRNWENSYRDYFQSEPVDVFLISREHKIKILLNKNSFFDELRDKVKSKQLQKEYFDTFRALVSDVGGPEEFKKFFKDFNDKLSSSNSSCSLKLDIPIRGPVPSFRSDIERISFYRMKDIIQDENYFNPESPVSSFSCSEENGFLGVDYSKGKRK